MKSDDIYMKDPKAKTLEGFIEAINIFAKYIEKGLQQPFFFQGEHDIILAYIDDEKISEDSADGQQLIKLGWHLDEDNGWAYFT